jgi:hypothetical protein
MTATTTVGTAFEQLRTSVQAELLARVPDHIERLRWSREQIETAQREGLRALLAHAIENSPFHRRRLGHIDSSRFNLADLTSLPAMTKSEMMESLDEVFTDTRLNRALVEQALAATTPSPSRSSASTPHWPPAASRVSAGWLFSTPKPWSATSSRPPDGSWRGCALSVASRRRD